MEQAFILLALVAPAIAAVVLAVARPDGLRPGRVVTAACGIATIAAVAVVVWSATRSAGVVGGTDGLGLHVDRAGGVLLAAITATGTVVASFARRNIDVDPRSCRFFTHFAVLVSASTLVVVSGGLWLLLLGWVVSGRALVGLVGYAGSSARRARLRTAMALTVGDLSLAAAVLVAVTAGVTNVTRDPAAALDDLRSSQLLGLDTADIVATLVVIAGISRSSLVPLHRWLVATLAAPTPVSALVHAGFVSGAGLLVLRFRAVVLDSAVALYLAFAIAVITVVVATAAASQRVDVKGKLAWSTVGQMGFMVLQCTVGAFSSAVFHIVGHGMYKATMFLGAGDAINTALQKRRRATSIAVLPVATRAAASMLISTIAVAIGLTVIPPVVSDGGVVLIAVFSWLTVAHGVWGWLNRSPLAHGSALGVAALGGIAATFAYLGGLRAVEEFLAPSFVALESDAGVDIVVLISVLVVVGLVGLVTTTGLGGTELHERGVILAERWAHPGIADPVIRRAAPPSAGQTGPVVAVSDPTRRAPIRSDVTRAKNVIAPSWPLTSFVAVNPLGGLEQAGFEAASRLARRTLGARTHLSLDDSRRDHLAGHTTSDDLEWAIHSRFAELCAADPIHVAGREIPVADIIELDLLHGPDADDVVLPRTALERVEGVDGPIGEMIDLAVSHSAAQHMSKSPSTHGADTTFRDRWCRDATSVSALRRHLGPAAHEWLRSLDADPALVIDTAFAVSGVGDEARVNELRGHLARVQGWAGVARWRTEWAHADEWRPPLAPVDLAAARCALEAAWLIGRSELVSSVPATPPSDDLTAQRTSSVLAALGMSDTDGNDAIAQIIDAVAPSERNATWLAARERQADQRMLTTLDRLDPGAPDGLPTAQLVFCIDVRSEGLRRNLENVGPYETFGFAGFFGVPMAVRRVEWSAAEARCPVLVSPSVGAVELPRNGADDVTARITRSTTMGALTDVHKQTKNGRGAPFVMAEAAGWLVGPLAAARTFLPRESRPVADEPTMVELAGGEGDAAAQQRVNIAEAVLTTMGLTSRFAPLVVLCGHASDNINNAHATALDCGACAGASGQDNSRAVATLLNLPEVRSGLRERGIEIPDSTHFLAGLHETVSDRVDLLDLADVPDGLTESVATLRVDLQTAAQGQSAARAAHLPGPSNAVGRRGTDWAQVRPEWGLARNSAFIIGPRSMTTGLDLDGRAFLHSYDANTDPTGKVLETIMTAPLVVGHWISSQYYFSTVDPEGFGAGDKLIHNVVGDLGVVSGEQGDLRVGLPMQSTHLGDERHHSPVRLLAVVQAPLERIEEIIRQNPILTTLIQGSWIRLAARSHAHERWSIRSPEGTWSAEPRPLDPHHPLEQS